MRGVWGVWRPRVESEILTDIYIYIYTLRTREVVPRDGPPSVDEAKSIEESIRFFLSIAFETLINLGAHL